MICCSTQELKNKRSFYSSFFSLYHWGLGFFVIYEIKMENALKIKKTWKTNKILTIPVFFTNVHIFQTSLPHLELQYRMSLSPESDPDRKFCCLKIRQKKIFLPPKKSFSQQISMQYLGIHAIWRASIKLFSHCYMIITFVSFSGKHARKWAPSNRKCSESLSSLKFLDWSRKMRRAVAVTESEKILSLAFCPAYQHMELINIYIFLKSQILQMV